MQLSARDIWGKYPRLLTDYASSANGKPSAAQLLTLQ